MRKLPTLSVTLCLFLLSLNVKAQNDPSLEIVGKYCNNAIEQNIDLKGTYTGDHGLLKLEKLVSEIWTVQTDVTFNWSDNFYETTLDLELGNKIRVKNETDGDSSDVVTFDKTYLKKPLFQTTDNLAGLCWNEEIDFSASYDCTPTGSPKFQLIFTKTSDSEVSTIAEYDVLPATITITPPGNGTLKLIANYGSFTISSEEHTISGLITTTPYEINSGGTFPFDQGLIPMTNFIEGDAPTLNLEKELNLNINSVTKNYLVYTEQTTAPYTFYKFVYLYENPATINSKAFNTEANGVTYNESAANRVGFYYGIQTATKTCMEKQFTDIIVLRNKIFIPQSSYCSDDAIETTITIDKSNDSYYADTLAPGFSQVVSYKNFILKVDDEEIEPHDTTYSIVGLPHHSSEKIIFSPDNLYVNGRDQVLVEITAYLTIDLFYEEPGVGYLPGWSSKTPYNAGDEVQYNGWVYSAKQNIPIKIYDKFPFEPVSVDIKQELEGDELLPLFTLYYPSPSSTLYWDKGDEYDPSGGGVKELKSSSTLPFASESFYIFKANENGLLDLEDEYCKSNNLIQLIESNGYKITGITKPGLPDPIDYITHIGDKWEFKTENVISDPDVISADVIWDLYYTDNHGCVAPAKEIKFKVNGNFKKPLNANLGLNAVYCPENTEISLIKSSEIYALTSAKVYDEGLWLADLSNSFNPFEYWNNEPAKTLEISFDYRHFNGCAFKDTFEVEILPKPSAAYTFKNVCFGDSVKFIGDILYPNSTEELTWKWDFDDYDSLTYTGTVPNDIQVPSGTNNGNTTGTYIRPIHKYTKAGPYNASLKVTSINNGCTTENNFDIIVGSYPVINIKPTGFIENDSTIFVNSSEDEIFDLVDTVIWNFDDPTSWPNDTLFQTSIESATHQFLTTGVHDVALKMITKIGCESSDTVKVPIFPYEIVTTDNTYEAIFDDLNQGWLSSDEFDKGLPSGWKRKTLAVPFNSSPNTTGMIWQTGDPNDNIKNESSWVESPCFDISGLDFPLLSMDIYQSVEAGRDGAAVQYTLDDGATWKLLGDEGVGVNWYDTRGIVGNPGNQGTGWSLEANEWKTARFSLDDIKDEISISGAACVRFRVAYSSDAGNASGSAAQGFAFDNFALNSRNRVVLMEQFVNSVQDKTLQEVEEAWLDAFVAGKGAEVVDMRYHNYISHDYDPLFYINPPDISSRSMEYGATRSQLTMIDGFYRCLADPYYSAESEARSYYFERSLTDIGFDIEVSHQISGENLSITADITKVKDNFLNTAGSEKCVIRMAIVQHEYINDGEAFKNVVVELLPNGEGNEVASIPADFAKGETKTVTGTWTPNVTTIGNEFRLVVYVQSIWGVDEVHQVWFEDSIVVPQITVAEPTESLKSGNSNDFTIYPSPVKEKLNINWKQTLESPVQWKLVSMSGTVVKQGITQTGEIRQEIDTYQFNKGVYLLIIEDQKSSEVEKRKIVIVK